MKKPNVIELRTKKLSDPVGPYLMYALGAFGLLNIFTAPLGALGWLILLWSVAFALQQFQRFERDKSRVLIDDEGIRLTTWWTDKYFCWNDLVIDETLIFGHRETHKAYRATTRGKREFTHGNPSGLISRDSGKCEGESYFDRPILRSGDLRHELYRNLDPDDYIDLIGILNVRVASRSNSRLEDLRTRFNANRLEAHDGPGILKAYGSLERLENIVEKARHRRSPLGFSMLPILEQYVVVLQSRGQGEKAEQIKLEMLAIQENVRVGQHPQ